ncbi:MAG: zinc ribbon domain-containing protein [Coriobacteriaceae bacterium]|jgi:putative FmdB family regulatory protein|nr:zinc ribbon domain-containing protein [Coriobacteriaceae bacterium]
MPRYSYRCTMCDQVSEFERPFGHLGEEPCPLCGNVAKRVFEVFAEAPRIGGGACSGGCGPDLSAASAAGQASYPG